MVNFAYGPASKSIKSSHGADTDLMKFYCTQNSTTYGSRFYDFVPQRGKHVGTGYDSNFRPAVFYNENLDRVDNPAMGALLRSNYETITQRSYRPSKNPHGREVLLGKTYQGESGFIRERPLSIPLKSDIRNLYVDTRIASAPCDFKKMNDPYLFRIKPKDPVQLENSGLGPSYMSTETTTKFLGQQPDKKKLSKIDGYKTGSGFIHSKNDEPITFYQEAAGCNTNNFNHVFRPIGQTVTQTDFQGHSYPKNKEPLPKISYNSSFETGFTKGNKSKAEYACTKDDQVYTKSSQVPYSVLLNCKKHDPAEYLNMTKHDNKSSITKDIFLGAQNVPKTKSDDLGTNSIGHKELSGFSINNDNFVESFDTPKRFITNHMIQFPSKEPSGLDRYGNVWGNIQTQKENGFTKSTKVHSFQTSGRSLTTCY